MVGMIFELIADIADVFVDLWINKVVAKFSRRKWY